MAWIKSHQELARHPKTRRLARLLDTTRVAVIGHLHCLWWWALDYAQDGFVLGFDADELAEVALWEGEPKVFVEALISAGFIDADSGNLHDWDDYAGKLITQRKTVADKQKRYRDRLQSQVASVTETATAASRDDHVTVTLRPRYPARVEKSREEIQNTNVSADALVSTASPETPSSQTYPQRKRGEKELNYWLRVVEDAKPQARNAILVAMAHEKIGVEITPDVYPRIGALAKRVGGGLLVRHIMTAAANHIDGDPISYLTALCNKTQKSSAAPADRADRSDRTAPMHHGPVPIRYE